MIDVAEAVERALQGESIQQVGAAYRELLLVTMGLAPGKAPKDLFVRETRLFVNKVCRELGDRHGGDRRAFIALRDWALVATDYEVFDALLTHFDFDGKDVFVQRGRVLFAGPLTSHWDG